MLGELGFLWQAVNRTSTKERVLGILGHLGAASRPLCTDEHQGSRVLNCLLRMCIVRHVVLEGAQYLPTPSAFSTPYSPTEAETHGSPCLHVLALTLLVACLP